MGLSRCGITARTLSMWLYKCRCRQIPLDDCRYKEVTTSDRAMVMGHPDACTVCWKLVHFFFQLWKNSYKGPLSSFPQPRVLWTCFFRHETIFADHFVPPVHPFVRYDRSLIAYRSSKHSFIFKIIIKDAHANGTEITSVAFGYDNRLVATRYSIVIYPGMSESP